MRDDKEYEKWWIDHDPETMRDMLQDAIAWYGLPEDALVWERYAVGSPEWGNCDAHDPAGRYVPRKDYED